MSTPLALDMSAGFINEKVAATAIAQQPAILKASAGGSSNYAADWVMDVLSDLIGRVEQDVDFADALGKGVDVGRAANVEPGRLGDTFLRQCGDAFFIDIRGDHRGPLARECACAGPV